MKVADIKLGWKKGPSADVATVETVVTIDGVTTTTAHGPEVEEFVIEAKASANVQFQVVTYDNEGYQASSLVYSFVVPDLEAPQPATDLFHEIVGIREVPDPLPPAA